MTRRHLKIPIPDWFPDAEDARVLLGRVKGKYTPFRCSTCDDKLKFKHPEFMSDVNGKRIGVSNSGESLCAPCLSDEIAKVFVWGTGVEVAKCYCCEEEKKTVDIVWGLGDNQSKINVRFLTRWWNGNPLCLDCIQSALDKSKQTSSFIKYHRGKSYYVNSKGGLIRV